MVERMVTPPEAATPHPSASLTPSPQGEGFGVAQEILEKLALWVKAQEPEKLSVQNLKHATGVLKDLREILKSDMPDKPVQIKVQIGNEEFTL